MNIFILDIDTNNCAQYHIDKHCVKMILETTQLLNNAAIAHYPGYDPIYRQTHKNHPCSLWVCRSRANFDWLAQLGLALCKEYTFRYGKIHKCQAYIETLAAKTSRLTMPDDGLTQFALCMPEQYRVADPVESYRRYYRSDKAYIAKWTKRPEPYWWRN